MTTSITAAIRSLMRLWEADDRFVPEGVRGWELGQMISEPPEWRWIGGKDRGGHDVHLDLFHNWTKIDQQAMLESAVGKIFSVLSTYDQTVVQIQGSEVSIKHRGFKQVRRFKSQKVMVANLFNAIRKMVEVEWLPMHKSKDSKYHYTPEAREKADYEMSMLEVVKKAMRHSALASVVPGLPKDDPFAGDPYFDRPS